MIKIASRIVVLSMFFILVSGFQLFKTSLKIQVLNDLGNIEQGATVKLFMTEEDYNNEENVIREGTTDKKGYVVFSEVEAHEYYVNVEKGDKNNYGAGEKIEMLEEGKMNRITVIISE